MSGFVLRKEQRYPPHPPHSLSRSDTRGDRQRADPRPLVTWGTHRRWPSPDCRHTRLTLLSQRRSPFRWMMWQSDGRRAWSSASNSERKAVRYARRWFSASTKSSAVLASRFCWQLESTFSHQASAVHLVNSRSLCLAFGGLYVASDLHVGGSMEAQPSELLRCMLTNVTVKKELKGQDLSSLWNILIDMAERLEKLEAASRPFPDA